MATTAPDYRAFSLEEIEAFGLPSDPRVFDKDAPQMSERWRSPEYEPTLRALGAYMYPQKSFEEAREIFHQTLNELEEYATTHPEKPGPGTPVDVIPLHNGLQLVCWSAGHGETFIGFYDTSLKEHINRPDNYALHSSDPDKYPTAKRLKSEEDTFGVHRDQLRPGAEKYCLRGGTHVYVACSGQQTIHFCVPTYWEGDPRTVEAVPSFLG